MKKFFSLFAFFMILNAAPLGAVPGKDPGAPEALSAWKSWALYGHEEAYNCPLINEGGYACAWPVSLKLDLNDQGGRFEAVFELLNEGSFLLPGGRGAWPQNVREGDREVPVTGSQTPRIFMEAGRRTINGEFKWQNLPETMEIPSGFVLRLILNEKEVDFPSFEPGDRLEGFEMVRLWLQKREIAEEPEGPAAVVSEVDSLKVTVDRLIQDSQPIMVKSRLKVVVSGRPREILIKNALLPETKATFLASPLPAQLTAEGLRIQAKPGVHEIFIDARSLGQSEKIGPSSGEFGTEFWAFQPQPQLRKAEVSGASQVDASQVDIYLAWRNFSIYALASGEALTFNTLLRGDPDPGPDQLRLERRCWLDYNGKGLSCRDTLSGFMRRQWHLNINEPFKLGQASLNGLPQVITWQIDSKGQKAPGLQLRNDRVNVTADLRIDAFNGVLPASGWDHKLESGPQALKLPPGYHIFHASGAKVDRRYGAYGTWTGAWGALDFFIVLIITLAIYKFYGRKWALPAFLALILCYHEPMAPKMVLLSLLGCAALLKILPPVGKIRFLIRGWRLISMLILILLASFFLINQARVTLFPQLEHSHWSNLKLSDFFMIGGAAPQPRISGYDGYQPELTSAASPDQYYNEKSRSEDIDESVLDFNRGRVGDREALSEIKKDVPQRNRSAKLVKPSAKAPQGKLEGSGSSYAISSQAKNMSLSLGGADAQVQNSLARPKWEWNTVFIDYQGDVTADQSVKLYLIPPAVWRILGALRIIFMTWLVLLMLEVGRLKNRSERSGGIFKAFPVLGAAMVFGLMAALAAPVSARADNAFPDEQILDEYRQRLLTATASPHWEPGVPELKINLKPESLRLEFVVEMQGKYFFTLPNLDHKVFHPTAVTLENGQNLPLLNDSGYWMVWLPEGRHKVVLEGRLKPGRAFQISFPSKVQRTLVETGAAWRVEGLDADGQMSDDALYVVAAGAEEGGVETPENTGTSVNLEPFFMVNRTISLGLEWKVYTTVQRITPVGAPVSLKLPLLPHEAPISSGIRHENGLATVNFGSQATSVTWESSLKEVPELELLAADGSYAESWSLDAASIWRVKTSDLIPVHRIVNGVWNPTWRPWPGEKLSLSIDRPKPVPGEYLAIDQAALVINVAEQNRRFTLSFKVRTSQGGPYQFNLPSGAELQTLTLNSQSLPNAASPVAGGAEGPLVTVPLNPGEHNLEVVWLSDEPVSSMIKTPALDLKARTANISVQVNLPSDRWLLFTGGPMQGPAVLFWPLLAVILIAAVVLGRFKLAPIKTSAWFLLGLGLTQLSVVGALIVGGWLLLLGRRERTPITQRQLFNFNQMLLVVWTFAALWLIYKSIAFGLLASPDMLVEGNGSHSLTLKWFQDLSAGLWPVCWALSTSNLFYKLLMLAWALWLAISLIKWLKWGWGAFSSEHLWKKGPPKPPREKFRARNLHRRRATPAEAAETEICQDALEPSEEK